MQQGNFGKARDELIDYVLGEILPINFELWKLNHY